MTLSAIPAALSPIPVVLLPFPVVLLPIPAALLLIRAVISCCIVGWLPMQQLEVVQALMLIVA